MKLTNVKIHNVRSIKDADICLSDYSILIGANNTGKSNIVSALRLFYEDEKMSFKEERDFPTRVSHFRFQQLPQVGNFLPHFSIRKAISCLIPSSTTRHFC